jgi:hypothetical protein
MDLKKGYRLIKYAVALVWPALTFSTPAAASPQVLGLMASNEPINFNCSGSECYGLVGAFCLQRDHDVPAYGQSYQVNLPERLSLRFRDGAGAVKDVQATAAHLQFSTYSGYSMVRVSIPRLEMQRLGAVTVELQIGPGVSLVPEAAGDANGQTSDEIALATGPLRIAAARYLDESSPNADSARLVAALANGLPERRTIHDDFSDLWVRTISDNVLDGINSLTLQRVERSYQSCIRFAEGSLRQCLISHHRNMMISENRRFWDETGSY